MSFQFLAPGPLADAELSVVLARTRPADPKRGLVPSYDFDMIVADQRAGKVNFRAGNTTNIQQYGGHFGYGVDEPFRGHHYAERTVRLLLPFAAQHGLRTLWITCNPDNWPSRRTCERLGATMVEIVPLPHDLDMYLAGERFKCRYRIELEG